jgi:hypothetical protein
MPLSRCPCRCAGVSDKYRRFAGRGQGVERTRPGRFHSGRLLARLLVGRTTVAVRRRSANGPRPVEQPARRPERSPRPAAGARAATAPEAPRRRRRRQKSQASIIREQLREQGLWPPRKAVEAVGAVSSRRPRRARGQSAAPAAQRSRLSRSRILKCAGPGYLVVSALSAPGRAAPGSCAPPSRTPSGRLRRRRPGRAPPGRSPSRAAAIRTTGCPGWSAG